MHPAWSCGLLTKAPSIIARSRISSVSPWTSPEFDHRTRRALQRLALRHELQLRPAWAHGSRLEERADVGTLGLLGRACPTPAPYRDRGIGPTEAFNRTSRLVLTKTSPELTFIGSPRTRPIVPAPLQLNRAPCGEF